MENHSCGGWYSLLRCTYPAIPPEILLRDVRISANIGQPFRLPHEVPVLVWGAGSSFMKD